jgi:UDP-3-O-[3-hydroxymyristoyl] glucosamine N-acyltransferase
LAYHLRMASREMRISELAEALGRPFEGDGEFRVCGVGPLSTAGDRNLGFLRSERMLSQLAGSRVGALIAPSRLPVGDRPVIRSDNPGLHFARAVALLLPELRPDAGIHPSAQIDSTASVDPTASVGAGVVIGPRCAVGPGCLLHARVTLYADVRVGPDCVLHSGVVLREGSVLGEGVILQPGVIVGGDGFGYVFDESGGWERVPHVGRVVLEDGVEVGANTTIDRATLGETRIRKGSKLDNLVMVGHNCELGESVIVAGQSGFSGSVTVGDRVLVMGQVGVAGHLEVGEGAFLGARAGVSSDVRPGSRVWGTPHLEERRWFRSSVVFARLPEWIRRIRAIERHLGLQVKREQPDLPSGSEGDE